PLERVAAQEFPGRRYASLGQAPGGTELRGPLSYRFVPCKAAEERPMATLAPSAPTSRPRLLFPSFERVYDTLAPLSVFLMRVFAGLTLAMHGWPEIQDPFKDI